MSLTYSHHDYQCDQVFAELADATYIEGVYVSPEQRGKGVGRQCMLALGQALKDRTKAIYLFVENQQTAIATAQKDLAKISIG